MAEFDRPGADVPSEYTEVKPSTDGGLGGPGAFSGYVGETLMTPGASLATGRGEVYTGEPTGKGRIGLGGDAAVRTDFTEMRPASEVAADEGQPITGETRAAGAPSLGVLSAVKALKNRLNGGSLLPHSETTETAAPNGRVEGDGGIPPSAFTETVVAVAPETTFDTRAQHDAGTEQAEAEAGLPDDAAGPYDVPSTAMPLAEVPLVSEVPDGKIPEVPEVPPESTVPPEATGQPEYDATAPEADDMPPPTEGAEGTGYPEQRYKHDAQTTSGQQETATDQPSDEPGRQPHEAADIETPPEAPEPTEPTDATDVPEIPNTEEGRDTGDAFSEPVTEYTEPNATEPATETQGTGEVLADGTVYAEIVDDMPSEGRPAEVGDPDFGPVEEAELVEPGTEPWLDGTPETPEASEPKEASGPHEIIDAEEVEEVYDDASETPDAQEAFAIGDGREAQEADEVEEAQEVPETAEYTEPSESASEGTAVSEEELAPEALAALLKEGAEREETYDDAHAELTEHIEQAEEAEPGAEVLDTEAEAGVEAAEVDEAAEVPVESDTAEEQVAAEEVPAVEEAAVEANEEAAEDAKARTREASEAVAEAAEQAEEAPVFTEQQQVPPEQAEKPANAEGGEQTETSDATDEDAETSEDTEGSLSPEAQALLEHLPEGTRELVVDLINEYGVNPEQAIRLVLEMRERLDDPSEATDRPTEANDKADEYNDMWAQRNHTGTPFGWNQPDEGRPVVRKIGQAAAAVGRFLWGATKFIGITAGSEVIGGGAALTQKIKVVGTPEFTRKSLFGLLPDRYRVTITNGSNTSTVEVGADDAKDATAKVESYGIGRARIRAGKKLN